LISSSELKKRVLLFFIADEKTSAKGRGNGMRKCEGEKRAPLKNLAWGPRELNPALLPV